MENLYSMYIHDRFQYNFKLLGRKKNFLSEFQNLEILLLAISLSSLTVLLSTVPLLLKEQYRMTGTPCLGD